VIAWAGGHLASVLWEPLASATLYSTSALLRVISDDVVVDPGRSLLALGEFGVTVAPVCSGLEGMGLITVLLSAMLFVLRRQFRFPHALLIVPLGVLTVWIGNSVRLALLMVIGAHIDENVALGGFHSKAGWVIFCAVTLGVAALARRWRFVSARPAEAELDSENPVAGYLAPLLVVTATGLLTGLISSGHDPYYGVRILPAAVALYLYRRYHERVRLASSSFVALGVGVLVGVAWVVTEEPTTPVPLSTVSSVWLVFRVIGFVGVAAICEELAFRGYLLRRLIASDFSAVSFRAWTPLAVIGSSFLFGALHERWLAASLAGVAYAFVQIRSGRNADAVIAHAATNGVIAARSLAVGNVAGWG
jgi:exosortase E/protease (VPEID-CTERM system)